jgi:hypothetical protein
MDMTEYPKPYDLLLSSFLVRILDAIYLGGSQLVSRMKS